MPKRDFWKHVVTVLLGATGAQAVPLLAAPLVTRLCGPAEMGTFSLWLGVVTVASILATLRFDAVMVLELDQEQQRLCFGSVAYAATVVALASTLLAAAAHAAGWSLVRDLSWFDLSTLGVGIWLTAGVQVTLAYATSHQHFHDLAKARITQAAAIAALQIALLVAGVHGTALAVGQLAGLGTGLWMAWRLLRPPAPRIGVRLHAAQRAYLASHRAFWRFSLPAALLNTLAGQLPLFLIESHHGARAAGWFVLAQRVLSAPTSLIAASIMEVFKSEAVHEFESVGHCRALYRATFKTLVVLALVPSLLACVFAPDLFAFVFGPDWRPAGELARLLAPLSAFNFIAGPFGYVFLIAGKQKMELCWQVAQFLMTFVVFSLYGLLERNVIAYTVCGSVLCVVHLFLSYHSTLNRAAAT